MINFSSFSVPRAGYAIFGVLLAAHFTIYPYMNYKS